MATRSDFDRDYRDLHGADPDIIDVTPRFGGPFVVVPQGNALSRMLKRSARRMRAKADSLGHSAAYAERHPWYVRLGAGMMLIPLLLMMIAVSGFLVFIVWMAWAIIFH